MYKMNPTCPPIVTSPFESGKVKAMSVVSPLYPDTLNGGYPLHLSAIVVRILVSNEYVASLMTNVPANLVYVGNLLPGLEGKNVVLVFFFDYEKDSSLGDYTEFLIALPVAVSNESKQIVASGCYIPYIYVDQDATLGAGREIGGFPKKLAVFGFEQCCRNGLPVTHYDVRRITGTRSLFPRQQMVINKESIPKIAEVTYTATNSLTLQDLISRGVASPTTDAIQYRVIPASNCQGQASVRELINVPLNNDLNSYTNITQGVADLRLYGGPDDQFQLSNFTVLDSYSYSYRTFWNVNQTVSLPTIIAP